MKKSKFLQNSKDMLSRSFNPAKCKTSLRLAGSRLKLLRNKKEVHVKQMKKEIAQLLESGQDRTARIRVEHVIREERMMAAYDLLEIYCELIVARLPILESQKNIPIDLKEAIACVVFASPRCGDVPELLDVRKQFTAKYGKDFTTAAIELRPDCGVGRMLVEKLSAVAPDGLTKAKMLSAIAEENNVSWDPNSLDEKEPMPPNSLLSGPSTFGKASTLYAESPQVELDIQAPPPSSDTKMHSTAFTASHHDPKTSVGKENISSAQNYGISTTLQPETMPPGFKKTQLFQEESHAPSFERQRWNMEFKDATAAAQAAAESAERASMAARAAAELSNRDRIMRQSSSSDGHVLRNEGRENYETSKLVKPLPEDSVSSSAEKTKPRREQVERTRPYNEKTSSSFKEDSRGNAEYIQSASLKSKASSDIDTKDHDVLDVDAHFHKKSLKVSRGEMNMKKQPVTYEAETRDDWPEKSDNFREKETEKQSSVSFSRSHSNISDDVNIFSGSKDRKFEFDAAEESFVVGLKKQSSIYEAESTNDRQQKSKHPMEERIVKLPNVNSSSSRPSISDVENIFVNSEDQNFGHEVDEDLFVGTSGESVLRKSSQISSHKTAAVVFDKSDSDSDGGFELGPAYDEPIFHMPSKLTEKNSEYSDSWSPVSGSTEIVKPNAPSLFYVRKNSSHDRSENLVSEDGSEVDNHEAVKFDYSDGPSSESDDGKDVLGHTVKQDSRDLSSTRNSSSHSVRSKIKEERSRESLGSPFKKKGYLGFGRKQSSLSSDDDLIHDEIFDVRGQGKSRSPEKSIFGKSFSGKKKGYSGFGSELSSPLSVNELMSEEIPKASNQGKSSPLEKLSFGKSSAGKPASTLNESRIESYELGNESSSDSGEGLNFGKLTGGFRHKGYNQPPYLKNQFNGPLLKKESRETAYSNVRSMSPPTVESSRLSNIFDHKKSTRIPVPTDSDSDSSDEEEYLEKRSDHRKGRVTSNAAVDAKVKSSLRASGSTVGYSNNNLDENALEESVTRKNHLRSGISQRTKASSSSSERNSYTKTQRSEYETLDSDVAWDRKSRVSETSEIEEESESRRKSSKRLENYERPSSANVPSKPAKSNIWAPPEQPNAAKAAHVTLHESKMRFKSEVLDNDARNARKPVKTQPGKSEALDSDAEEERKSTRTETSETLRELESERKNYKNWESSNHRTSTKVASETSVWSPPKQHNMASSPNDPSLSRTPEQPSSMKSTTLATPESRISHKSSTSEQPSSPQRKAEPSVSNENPKTSTLNKTHSNKGDGIQKASHVHPKLPDYDSLVQALWKKRP